MSYVEVITDAETGKQTVRQMTQDEIDAIKARSVRSVEQLRQDRAKAYAEEADPLFFKAQRGEATIEEWKAKVEEIKARYSYPESTTTPVQQEAAQDTAEG
jgi:16S rRNA G527 N7-methylase RsmG